MAFACTTPSQAASWRFSPSVGATATYTDNARQGNNNSDDALILSVTPGFSLNMEGSRRLNASINYSMTAVTRFGGSDDSDLYHSLGAIGRAEIVDDFFFVDATARLSQNLVSLFGSDADVTSNNANRANSGVFSISPYVVQRFGTFATGQARYTTGGAIYGDNAAANARINAFTAGLASGSQFNDLSWALNYSIRDADNRGNVSDSTFERASATLGYALTRKFRVFGTVGREWNDFISAGNVDGDSYSVGFGWAPNQRTSIEMSAGERYFGRTFSASGAYRTRATNWTLRYVEDVSDITQQLLEDSGRIFWACNGSLFETLDFNPPAGQANCAGPFNGFQIAQVLTQFGVPLSDLIALGLLNVGLNNGVFVSKSLRAGVSWRIGPRTDLGVSAFDTRRLYQAITDAEDRSRGLSSTVSYRLSPHTSANGSIGYTRNSGSAALLGSARDDDTVSLSLGMNHRFSRDLTGALTFRHQQRDSNTANADYTENSVSASVNMRF